MSSPGQKPNCILIETNPRSCVAIDSIIRVVETSAGCDITVVGGIRIQTNMPYDDVMDYFSQVN